MRRLRRVTDWSTGWSGTVEPGRHVVRHAAGRTFLERHAFPSPLRTLITGAVHLGAAPAIVTGQSTLTPMLKSTCNRLHAIREEGVRVAGWNRGLAAIFVGLVVVAC